MGPVSADVNCVSPMPPGVIRAPGDLLDGRYRLVARLGQGGFGDVWRAEELLPDGAPFREVALKLLVGDVGSAVDWAEEAKLLASFRHPSLVTVYAAGIFATTVTPESIGPPSPADARDARDALALAHGATLAQASLDTPAPSTSGLGGRVHDTARVLSSRLEAQRYVAMELLDGQNLAEVAKGRGPLPWRRVLAWARSAAAALDVIHRAGVVHLDLKPANLFLCSDGTLKVLDFGIARRSGGDVPYVKRSSDGEDGQDAEEDIPTAADVTMRSHGDDAYAATHMAVAAKGRDLVIGTPGYMAPEVLDLKKPTAAADAYALAVCVVQLCTGRLPHLAPDEPEVWTDPSEVSAWLEAIRAATLRGTMRPLDEGPHALPRALAALLNRLLAVAPEARGVTAGWLFALFDEVWARPHGVPEPPYFARRPYPPEAEGVLFGRDDDIARLGRELAYEPSIVLQGPKGSGKSSLITAGLIPHLAKLAVDGKDEWIGVPIRSAEDLRSALAQLAAATDRVGRVLILDPLEDLFSFDLVSELAALTERQRPGVRVVGAVGEEATSALLGSPIGPVFRSALRFVGPPATAGATDIVERPARHAGVALEDGEIIANDVRRELRASGSRLPFVALALEEWWRAGRDGEPGRGSPRPSGGREDASAKSSAAIDGLSGARWRQTGGIAGAVVRHAAGVLDELARRDRSIAEEVLLRLSATDGASLQWEEEELARAVGSATNTDPGEVRAVLDRLKAELIVRPALTTPLSSERRAAVEIGHEALLQDWPRLASLRLAEMDRLLALERVREARFAWERADNHVDFLMHGAALADARARRGLLERGLGASDRVFLDASLWRARVRRGLRSLAVVVLGCVLLAGGLSKRMIDEAREDEARAKAAATLLEQLSELAARARRSEDPYARAALIAAALVRGSTDGLLPLDLFSTAQNLARADFLTRDRVDGPSFPWDDRFLVAGTSASSLLIVDFRPPEPDVIEDVDLDADPSAVDLLHFKRPQVHRLRPHEAALVERVDFAFDTAFATRAADGEVKVFRVREDGAPALAAVAPMRCVGPIHVAASAPVLACGVNRARSAGDPQTPAAGALDGGDPQTPAAGAVARWDMRLRAAPDAVTYAEVPGELLDLSADGEHLAIVSSRELRVWTPRTGARLRYVAPQPITAARISPHATTTALLEGGRVEIVDGVDDSKRPGDQHEPRFAFDVSEPTAIDLRWDEGGLDVAVCEARGGRWYYLRRGARAPDDPRPSAEPCARPHLPGHTTPEIVPNLDAAPELADRDFGPHSPAGGFRLRAHRYLSRDLVVLDPGLGRDAMAAPDASIPAAWRLLHVAARDDIGAAEQPEPEDSIAAVERDETAVMFQVGDEMRFYAVPEGARLFVRKGNFLRRCSDGRFLAWEAAGDSYRIFDAWTGGLVRSIAREPGLLIGAGGACRSVYAQRLDGTIVDRPLDARPTRELGKADGYAFEARPSGEPGSGSKTPPGLLISFSSGAIARIDDATHTLDVLGYATPFARAVTDGPGPLEVIFADASGVALLKPHAAPVPLSAVDSLVEWSDLAVSRDGITLHLLAPGRVAALDIPRRELLGSFPLAGKDRFARWDDEGSLLAWSFARKGASEGVLLPLGVTLARHVAEAVSNLEVTKGKVSIRP